MRQFAVVLLLTASVVVGHPCGAAENSFRLSAIFSDQAGLYQYIQLDESLGLDNQHHLAGLTLEVTSRQGVVRRITLPADLPQASTAGRGVVIGTANGPSVDFTLPDGFLPTDGGTLVFAGLDAWTYGALVANGFAWLLRDGTYVGGPLFGTPNPSWSAHTFAGADVSLVVLSDPVVEYHNAALDHYFITMSQPDIDALDSGRIPGWVRTGEVFDAAMARYTNFEPILRPVCRLYLPHGDGDSHFFSASATECDQAQSEHPSYVLETRAAFLAWLPDAVSGACHFGAPVYRLWNGRADSNHRYTASPAIRDLMRSRGYVAEGYGPDSVAMCVGTDIVD